MTFDRTSVQLEQFANGFFLFLGSRKRSRDKLVPAFFAALALLHDQHGTGCQLPNAMKYRQRRRRISKTEKQIQGYRIDIGTRFLRSQNRANFGTES